jgi:hypothetical protein
MVVKTVFAQQFNCTLEAINFKRGVILMFDEELKNPKTSSTIEQPNELQHCNSSVPASLAE